MWVLELSYGLLYAILLLGATLTESKYLFVVCLNCCQQFR